MNQLKKKKRHVFGRLKGIEVGEKIYTFEMRKATRDPKTFQVTQEGGVRVRRRGSKTVNLATFSNIVFVAENETAATHDSKVFGCTLIFKLSSTGLTVIQKGMRKKRVIALEDLANMLSPQPQLFLMEPDKKA